MELNINCPDCGCSLRVAGGHAPDHAPSDRYYQWECTCCKYRSKVVIAEELMSLLEKPVQVRAKTEREIGYSTALEFVAWLLHGLADDLELWSKQPFRSNRPVITEEMAAKMRCPFPPEDKDL